MPGAHGRLEERQHGAPRLVGRHAVQVEVCLPREVAASQAAEHARTHGATVIGLVGFKGGKLKEIADISVHSQIEDYGPVEDCHLMLDHIFVEALREHIRAS